MSNANFPRKTSMMAASVVALSLSACADDTMLHALDAAKDGTAAVRRTPSFDIVGGRDLKLRELGRGAGAPSDTPGTPGFGETPPVDEPAEPTPADPTEPAPTEPAPTEPAPTEPAPVPSDVVAPPASVTSVGFFVKDGEIYDPAGRKFLMRGINHTHWFGDQPNNLAAVDEFPATGTNIVRAVFGPDFGVDTPAEKREVVARYASHDMPVMVEDHRGTCDTDPATITEIVDEWVHPENVAWLNDYEDLVILNIANEWGPSDAAVWSATYQTAITRIRNAGIKNMIVVDAGGSCGQNVNSVLEAGHDILDADPEHNVAFSIHMYGFWRTSEATDVGSWGDDGTPWSIATQMEAVRAAQLPILIGEIAHDDADQVGYQTREALLTLQDLGIGWIAWSWNQNSAETYDLRAGSDEYTYEGPQSLTPGGQLFLLDPEVGFQATSRPATFQ